MSNHCHIRQLCSRVAVVNESVAKVLLVRCNTQCNEHTPLDRLKQQGEGVIIGTTKVGGRNWWGKERVARGRWRYKYFTPESRHVPGYGLVFNSAEGMYDYTVRIPTVVRGSEWGRAFRAITK